MRNVDTTAYATLPFRKESVAEGRRPIAQLVSLTSFLTPNSPRICMEAAQNMKNCLMSNTEACTDSSTDSIPCQKGLCDRGLKGPVSCTEDLKPLLNFFRPKERQDNYQATPLLESKKSSNWLGFVAKNKGDSRATISQHDTCATLISDNTTGSLARIPSFTSLKKKHVTLLNEHEVPSKVELTSEKINEEGPLIHTVPSRPSIYRGNLSRNTNSSISDANRINQIPHAEYSAPCSGNTRSRSHFNINTAKNKNQELANSFSASLASHINEVHHTDTLTKCKIEDRKVYNDRYHVQHEIGRGTCGKVQLAYDLKEERYVAIKQVRRADERKRIGGPTEAQQRHLAFLREVAIMKKLRHKNIVSLYEVIDDPNAAKLYLVMQYVDNGPIARIAVSPGHQKVCEPTPTSDLIHYARQMLSGIEYLHNHNVVHRDIKPENVLVSKDKKVYLSDFGVSETFDTSHRSRMERMMQKSISVSLAASTLGTISGPTIQGTKGTMLFIAPELWKGERVIYGKPVDIWAMGVTFYILLTGCLPFRTLDDINNPLLPEIPTSFGAGWAELLRGMLDRTISSRLTAHQARKMVKEMQEAKIYTMSDPSKEKRGENCDTNNYINVNPAAATTTNRTTNTTTISNYNKNNNKNNENNENKKRKYTIDSLHSDIGEDRPKCSPTHSKHEPIHINDQDIAEAITQERGDPSIGTRVSFFQSCSVGVPSFCENSFQEVDFDCLVMHDDWRVEPINRHNSQAHNCEIDDDDKCRRLSLHRPWRVGLSGRSCLSLFADDSAALPQAISNSQRKESFTVDASGTIESLWNPGADSGNLPNLFPRGPSNQACPYSPPDDSDPDDTIKQNSKTLDENTEYLIDESMSVNGGWSVSTTPPPKLDTIIVSRKVLASSSKSKKKGSVLSDSDDSLSNCSLEYLLANNSTLSISPKNFVSTTSHS